MRSGVARGNPFLVARDWLERLPYSVIALVARAAAFTVFWRSGAVKLDDWAGTLSLFESEYKVPLIPPHLAAYLSAALELGGSVLLLAGLGTRAVALAFLGMIAVIQLFVYPEAWPTHIQWLAFLLLLLARGAGAISLDALLGRLLQRRQ
jgi:putative oxidoreductase